MRKAFTLVEMLLILAIVPLVALALDRILAPIITEVPRACKVAQEHTTMLNMLSELRTDIESAKSLPRSYQGRESSDTMLLIESADTVLYYRLEDGRIVKGILPQDDSSRQRAWRLPSSAVKWTLWVDNGEPYAVEVMHCIKYTSAGKHRQAMANGCVLFAGAAGGGSK